MNSADVRRFGREVQAVVAPLKRRCTRFAPAWFVAISVAAGFVGLSATRATAQSAVIGGKSRAPGWMGVRPDLTFPAQALGNRLRTAGMERIAVSGVITQRTGAKAFVLIRELPLGKVRLVRQGQAALIFDRSQTRLEPNMSVEDQDVLETLVYDWPDQFFTSHGDGSGLRQVASAVRPQPASGLSGAAYKVYETVDKVATRSLLRAARYWFSRETGLLERIQYVTASGRIEVRFSNWLTTDGQRTPGRIDRLQNGQTTLTLTFSAPSFSAAADDGIFKSSVN